MMISEYEGSGLILDPKLTFHMVENGTPYKAYYKEVCLDPELEAFEDDINEAVSLYNFYIQRATNYIIESATDLTTIRDLEDFIVECIQERTNLATYYDCNKIIELEEDCDDYKAPVCSDFLSTDRSIVFPNGDEYFFSEAVDTLLESTNKYNQNFKRILYQKRIKSTKQVLNHYKYKKDKLKGIKYYFTNLDMYKKRSIWVDLSYYYDVFYRDLDSIPGLSADKRVEVYYEFITRLLNETKYKNAGYSNFAVIIPIDNLELSSALDHRNSINPVSVFHRMMKSKYSVIKKEWAGKQLLFYTKYRGYFKVNVDEFEPNHLPIFVSNIKRILGGEIKNDENVISVKSKVVLSIDKLEKEKGITVNNLTGQSTKISQDELDEKIANSRKNSEDEAINADKKDLVVKIEDKAKSSKDTEEIVDTSSEDFERLIQDIQTHDAETVKISAARASRIVELNNRYMGAKVKDDNGNTTTVAELIATNNNVEELPVVDLEVDSINDEWHHMESLSFNESYDVDTDIYAIMKGFGDPDRISRPINVVDVSVEDNSTSEDYIMTYRFNMEDITGKRFNIVFDIPKLINNRFMRLRGNEKTISNQLVLYPVIKTDEDAVQLVSNYKKVFIYRYGNKLYPSSDLIIKAAEKYKGNKIKFEYGDNSRICSKYELPIDFIELASVFTSIEINNPMHHQKIYFNLDMLKEELDRLGLKPDPTRTPIGWYKNSNNKGKVEIEYIESANLAFSDNLIMDLTYDSDFEEALNSCNHATKYAYSRASILSSDIPVVVICGYLKGLEATLKEAGIEYTLQEKKAKSKSARFIKFKDGYLYYNSNYISEMLLNGLRDCGTEFYSIGDIVRGSTMWLDFLDIFGGRIKADGLDNFNDLMVDSPITTRVCDKLGLPKTFTGQLLYGNMLLADNKYNQHSDITGNRFRCGEIIAGYTYQCLATAYGQYATMFKKTGKGEFTMKRTAVIDAILLDPTMSDLSILTPLLEAEAANNVSFKGLTGMNSDRSYQLDKRRYDDSMINVLAMSTGFSGNVGITRQATIDKNIQGSMGWIKPSTVDDMSVTKSFSITEALNPMCTTREN